ncbi:MAG: D-glycero-beta-D-manno-heptose 1-phosphate adenylyltransferase [Flavobacteriales bacterium]|jgi:D-glycero-beta-D-manno-heptose 1-phosphate adenylyltransferase|nr:D-glycero-beta-D-manno-heptose 1-phosphate adenylyltransferase [Flavobacteriales bacterium]MBT6747020.1 D-glycero-beta-D-manno-heptose 1-phosphate adenylyltransferase [Flavobacteriales bacterium]
MNHLSQIRNKLIGSYKIVALTKEWKKDGETIVFTNGCFDLLHLGHIEYLARAASLGSKFIIGLNSDQSVKTLGKGGLRPIKDQKTRATILAALEFVSAVVIFNEDTPYQLISSILPNILVKGGDWEIDAIAGADVVTKNGGQVKSIPFVEGYSTTNYVEIIQNGKS